MTDRVTRANRIPAGLADSVRWANAAGETVPAYGVIQLRTNFAAPYSQASKPDSGEGLFFANGPVPVSATKHGESYLWNHPRLVLISDTPTVGDEVGPVADSWAMSTSGTGFRVIHQVVGGVGAVVPVGGGSGGGDNSLWGTVEEVVCDPYGDPLETYCWVEVTDFSGGCTTPIPGEDSYTGLVQVFQKCDTFTEFYTAEQLVGKTIEAGYYYPRTGDCEGRWLVRQICGTPECA